jgi:hypothetical protein
MLNFSAAKEVNALLEHILLQALIALPSSLMTDQELLTYAKSWGHEASSADR